MRGMTSWCARSHDAARTMRGAFASSTTGRFLPFAHCHYLIASAAFPGLVVRNHARTFCLKTLFDTPALPWLLHGHGSSLERGCFPDPRLPNPVQMEIRNVNASPCDMLSITRVGRASMANLSLALLILAGGCMRTSFDAAAESRQVLLRDAEWADATAAGEDEVSAPGPDGKVVTLPQRAVSIWRRGTDGVWRCVVDIANAPPAAAPWRTLGHPSPLLNPSQGENP